MRTAAKYLSNRVQDDSEWLSRTMNAPLVIIWMQDKQVLSRYAYIKNVVKHEHDFVDDLGFGNYHLSLLKHTLAATQYVSECRLYRFRRFA